MNIILNETEWAEDAIYKYQNLGRKPSETLQRVARYYIDQGESKKEVRKSLEKFIISCEPNASIPKWSEQLDRAIRRAMKREAVDVGYISITDKEIEIIDSLDGRQMRRLAFTLLCLSKYWNIALGADTYWVNSKDNEIMSMANINTSLKRQAGMYWSLKQEGLIEFSKKVDNTNVRVCFAKDGDTAIKVTDFRNLGYLYLMHHGEPYFECSNCGIICALPDPKNRRRQLYCNTCATKVKLQQNVNSAMRRRKKLSLEGSA